jgi:hypothetical protein
MVERLVEDLPQLVQPLHVLVHAGPPNLIAPKAIWQSAQPQNPQEGVTNGRLAAMERASRRLAGEQSIEPLLGVGKVARSRILEVFDPVTRAERQRHRFSLEGSLASEQVADRATRLADSSCNGIGVETGKGADRKGVVVKRLGVLLDLLEGDELADLDVTLSRLVFGQRRASSAPLARSRRANRLVVPGFYVTP